MLLRKPRELATASLVMATCLSSTFAEEAGRAAVTPLEQLKQETAQQRWERLKAKYQPMTVDPAAPVANTAARPGSVHPIPESTDSNGWGPTRPITAPPLPDGTEEPAWVKTAAPVEAVAEPVAQAPQVAARPTAIPVRQPISVPVPAPAPVADVLEPVELRAVDQISTIAAQSEPGLPPMPATGTNPMDPVVRRAVRQMNEINPFYDKMVDEDIREYANDRAAEYDVKFGAEDYQPRMFADTAATWEPTNYYHYPLYFEDATLERYGHTYPFLIQPVVSGAKFTGQLLALPYQMTLDPINKPKYALGWYRPGECAPKLKYQIPWNAQAAAVEAATVTGLIFLIP